MVRPLVTASDIDSAADSGSTVVTKFAEALATRMLNAELAGKIRNRVKCSTYLGDLRKIDPEVRDPGCKQYDAVRAYFPDFKLRFQPDRDGVIIWISLR